MEGIKPMSFLCYINEGNHSVLLHILAFKQLGEGKSCTCASIAGVQSRVQPNIWAKQSVFTFPPSLNYQGIFLLAYLGFVF